MEINFNDIDIYERDVLCEIEKDGMIYLVTYEPMSNKGSKSVELMLYRFHLYLTPIGFLEPVTTIISHQLIHCDKEKKKKIYLDTIRTEEIYRGKDFGSILLKVYIEYCKQLQVNKIFAEKDRYCERLVRFYTRAGFEMNDGRNFSMYL
jgi:N-acetylglutamate synthase-like GNAT family acetyltransferase